jgi:hypothetical protein
MHGEFSYAANSIYAKEISVILSALPDYQKSLAMRKSE